MSEVIYNRVNWKDTPSTETPINAPNLNKMDKGIADVAAAVNECFQSASEGKTLIAAALTGKGQASTVADTFAQMAAKIGNLMAVPTATKNITANGNNIDVTNFGKVNVSVVANLSSVSPTGGTGYSVYDGSFNAPNMMEKPSGYSQSTSTNGLCYVSTGTPTVSNTQSTITITIPQTIRACGRFGAEGDHADFSRNIVVTLSK